MLRVCACDHNLQPGLKIATETPSHMQIAYPNFQPPTLSPLGSGNPKSEVGGSV